MIPLSAWPVLLAGLSAAEPYKGVFDVSPPLIPQLGVAAGSSLFPMAECGAAGFKLEEATIEQMQDSLKAGKLTSVELVSCYMLRTFQTQPYINSLMQLNPNVLADAAARDEERRSADKDKDLGPLHGIPFTVKDNIAVGGNLETTAGSWALLGSVHEEAFVVRQLLDKGAVLFGKAAMSEWADLRSTNYSEGYSARGGQCRSAYNFTVNPGGSSSGSGVGVAANAIAFSLGTETDGSVLNPAMRNSIVGFKPTVGLTSRGGVIPESEHQDSVGTFGRTVRDAIVAFDAIYGVDERDNYTLAQKEANIPQDGYMQFLKSKSELANMTFGLPWKSFWTFADEESQGVLLEMVKLIEDAGATVVNETEITNHEAIVSPNGWDWDWGRKRGFPNQSEYTVVIVDSYININAYLSELKNTKISKLDHVIKFNEDNAGSEGGFPWPDGHPAFFSGQDGLLASRETKGERNETYWQALEFCQTSTRRGIDDALKNRCEKRLDGLLVPLEPGQSYQIAAQAGYPMITIPAGIHAESGMGFGLGIMQTAWGEAELIRAGSAIEDLMKGTKHERQQPQWRGYLERNMPVPL
ncbi:hypothetical protein CDD83_10404 [Cordyceps sp. RAO-2017]|nr:hypothetical protein CDD83_10404 [Cordyceps sp. RAO-2017]